MGKLFLLSFATLVAASCTRQYQPDVKDVKDFFAQLKDSVLTKKHFLLIDSAIVNWGGIPENAGEKDSFLTADDINYIKSEMRNHGKYVWTNAIFGSAIIVSQRHLDSIAAPNPFMSTPAFYSFSLPYFNKQKNYCILVYNYYCGNLCAETSVRLYKKVKQKWFFVKSYYRSVS